MISLIRLHPLPLAPKVVPGLTSGQQAEVESRVDDGLTTAFIPNFLLHENFWNSNSYINERQFWESQLTNWLPTGIEMSGTICRLQNVLFKRTAY